MVRLSQVVFDSGAPDEKSVVRVSWSEFCSHCIRFAISDETQLRVSKAFFSPKIPTPDKLARSQKVEISLKSKGSTQLDSLQETSRFSRDLSQLNPKADDYAVKLCDLLMVSAMEAGASDLHLDSVQAGLQVRFRTGGQLTDIAVVPHGQVSSVMARFKSMAGLLSYRTDVPQEGRIDIVNSKTGTDARVCTLPTLHGERLVIRFSIAQSHGWQLEDLGLPGQALARIQDAVASASGVAIVCGPAGSGKTTTAYAMMQRLAQANLHQRRCCVSLEDPIEQAIEGVAQSQIQPSVGYTWSAGLKAMLRQDPEVMLIGEIRDDETAHVVFQAAMTGQLAISTMHARSVADAVTRLMDMRLPKHQLCSSLTLMMAQRLLQRRLPIDRDRLPIDRDRLLLAEVLPNITGELREAIVRDLGSSRIHEVAVGMGMESLTEQAVLVLRDGSIDEGTFRRHFEWHHHE